MVWFQRQSLQNHSEDDDELPLLWHIEEKEKAKNWEPIKEIPQFVPAFEGLRGLAVLMTCWSHIDTSVPQIRSLMGVSEVILFYVLSGFLITGVLLRLQVRKIA